MRWFIVFLLIANILLFFWVQQESLRPSSQGETPPPEIGRLRLLNESPAPPVVAEPEGISPADDATAMQIAEPVDAEADPAPTERPAEDAIRAASVDDTDPLGQTESTAITESSASSDAPVPAVVAIPSEPAMVEAPIPPQATGEDVAQSASPAAEPDVVVAPPSVKQAEAESTTQGEAPVPKPVDPPPAVVETPPAPPSVCVRVGPFEPADADALLQNLPNRVELLSDTSEEQTINTGYYVLIPALPDRTAGLGKLEELEAAGFQDTWLFPRGPNRNAISLGLFRRKGGAERQASQVAAKGFEVEVRERTTTAERRWLQLKQVGGDDLQSTLSLPDGITLAPEGCP